MRLREPVWQVITARSHGLPANSICPLSSHTEPFQRGHRSGDDLGARNGQGSRAVG